MDIQNNGHTTNGKSQLPIQSLITVPNQHEPSLPQSHKFDHVLDLAKEAINLEMRLKEVMAKLEKEVSKLDQNGLPSVFTTMFRMSKGPGLVKSEPIQTVHEQPMAWVKEGTLKGRIVALMSDCRERKSAAIIKSLKAKKIQSSVYGALKELVKNGFLCKPAFGFYKKI